MKNVYYKLLKDYADGLISMQVKSKDKAFHGGISCRACKMIHGRTPDAVYGFTVMAKITRQKKYVKAAKDAFNYGDNMLCSDGSLYNDAQAEWRCTTVFHEVAVIEALRAGKHVFSKTFIKKMESRALKMAEWLYANLDENNPAHINYSATNGYALALAGNYFKNEKYLSQAKHLIEYAMKHFTDNGVLFGECTPHDAISDKKCRGIDIGYNMEESIPAIVKYAYEVGDEELKNRLEKILLKNLIFMFPDGGIDNSFGNRNYKWTYWGSRTSDGCATGLLLMADRNPVFQEAAYRNAKLLEKCTHNGLLYGGPHYYAHGEHPCTHHTFEHINALAFVVENIERKYLKPLKNVSLPSEVGNYSKYFEECRTYKLKKGDYMATITDCDHKKVLLNGSPTGATLSALYHKEIGPMIMASTTLYVLIEPTNMQQCTDLEKHRSLMPRIELEKDGVKYYSSCYPFASVSHEKTKSKDVVSATTGLADRWNRKLNGYKPKISYTLTKAGVSIKIENLKSCKYVLPLINGNCTVKLGSIESRDDIFFLIGGFNAKEYVIRPDKNGKIELKINA